MDIGGQYNKNGKCALCSTKLEKQSGIWVQGASAKTQQLVLASSPLLICL